MTIRAIDAPAHQWSVSRSPHRYPAPRPVTTQVDDAVPCTGSPPGRRRPAAPVLDARGFVHADATPTPRTYRIAA
ncbi:hypothetical protein [Tomitella gaofuii]|uniref:hypothetical protein n=1 Tax=Tomitella gaofuii TaxID=2760083 RepID=UPI0015FB03E9|nr:hypothetical protein [Tomitella gaofuii]